MEKKPLLRRALTLILIRHHASELVWVFSEIFILFKIDFNSLGVRRMVWIMRKPEICTFVVLPLVSLILACSDSSGGGDKGLHFKDVSEAAGLNYQFSPEAHLLLDKESGGVAVDDIDGDGDFDFFVAHGTDGASKLFRNEGDGTFKDITSSSGIETSTKARAGLFVDLNVDGLNDLVVSEAHPANITVFRNDGEGNYAEVSGSFGLLPLGATFSIAAGDIDKDNDLDIAVAEYHERPVENSYDGWLWENQSGTFVDITNQLPIPPHKLEASPGGITTTFQWNYTPNFSDVDNDGYLDILYAANFENSNIYLYDAPGSFLLASNDVFTDQAGMGAALGDYDNDGDMDWFITSIWHPDSSFNATGSGSSGNRFYKNDGAGNFSDVTDVTGVREGYFGWGACFGDFNNDGHLDLFHVNGYGDEDSLFGVDFLFFKDDPAVFFINNGDGTFSEAAKDIGIAHVDQGRGLSCFDMDNDGDLDILIANLGKAPTLYRNELSESGYIAITLKGLVGNHQGVGAKVWLTIGDSVQLREMHLGSNFLSSDPVVAHFGLGNAEIIDEITIEWNDAGNNESVLTQVPINQYVEIVHPSL